MPADIVTIHLPGTLGTNDLVLLHWQPGSPADWGPLAGRPPTQFHAVAADRPGYGSSVDGRERRQAGAAQGPAESFRGSARSGRAGNGAARRRAETRHVGA